MEDITKSAFYVTIPMNILHSPLSAKEMIMCGAIKGLSSTTGSCFAKNDTLATLLGWSEYSVGNILSRLYKTGAIVNIGKFKSRELILDMDFAGFSQNQKNGFSQNQNDFSQNQKNDTYIYTTKNNIGQIGSNDPKNDHVDLDKKIAFDTFWDMYPVKVKKVDAQKKFMKLKIKEIQEILDILPAVVDYYSQKQDKNTPFIPAAPYPTTFINGKRWQDVVFMAKNSSKGRAENMVMFGISLDEDAFMDMFRYEDKSIYPAGMEILERSGMQWEDVMSYLDSHTVSELIEYISLKSKNGEVA